MNLPNIHPNLHWVPVGNGQMGLETRSGSETRILFRSLFGPAQSLRVGAHTYADISVCGRFGFWTSSGSESIDQKNSFYFVDGSLYNHVHILSSSRQCTPISQAVGSYVLALKPEHWLPPFDLSGFTSGDVMARMVAANHYCLLSSPKDVSGFPFRNSKWSFDKASPVYQEAISATRRFVKLPYQGAGDLSASLLSQLQYPKLTGKVVKDFIAKKVAQSELFKAVMSDPEVHFVGVMGDYTNAKIRGGRPHFADFMVVPKAVLQKAVEEQGQLAMLLLTDVGMTGEVDVGPLYGGKISIPVVWAGRDPRRTDVYRMEVSEYYGDIHLVNINGRFGQNRNPRYDAIAGGHDGWADSAYDLYPFGSVSGGRLAAPAFPSRRENALSATLSGPLLLIANGDERWSVTASTILSRPVLDPEGHPGQIGYYALAKDIGHKITWTRPGRYLSKLTGGDDKPWGGQQGLQKAALELDTQLKPPVLHIAETTEDCVRVYKNGPSSCMSGDKAMVGNQHPACVYGGDADLKVAYLGTLEKSTARAVVWPEEKTFMRIYGDIERMTRALGDAGYEETETFDGAYLNLVPVEGSTGRIMMPYFDGDDDVAVVGDRLRVGGEGVCLPTDNTCGWSHMNSRFRCDDCEESNDEDDLRFVRDVGLVCLHCLDCRYVYVDREEEYFLANECTYVSEISEYVLNNDPRLFSCAQSGEYSVGNQYEVLVTLDGATEIWSETSVEDYATLTEDDTWVANSIVDEYMAAREEPTSTPRCPNTPDMFQEVASAT